MIATGCLLAILAVAAVADWRAGIIPNRLVYSGILLALLLNAAASLCGWVAEGGDPGTQRWGWVGLWESGAGLLACGGVMLVCYVLFAGQIGGGDVKLIALIGTWWGVTRGLEAMLWTLVIGACVAIVWLVWQLGAVELVKKLGGSLRAAWRSQGTVVANEADRRLLRTPLRLAPSAALGVLVVQFRLLDWF